MLCEIKIEYDYGTDKTTITACEDFNSLPAIHRADALKDALHELITLYNDTVKQIGKDAE